ncbi:cyclodeaminase [Sinobaca sp. H24]|uniref:cyclodeaminase n=1 Tax=Sinobaca sp. H24 TaxID=2923376 RepID=UPI002079D78A|nr:cyclodeaminase [Sinobaca sp. H24]
MYIFSEGEIRSCIKLDKNTLSVIEEGFEKLDNGEVTMPPVLRVDIPENNGEVDVKTAYVKGWSQFALKASSGFFNNPGKGLPSLSGMMLLFSTETGILDAFLQDNGYLTDIRTALAGAAASKYLAQEGPVRAGIIGTGAQARFQLRALALVRDIEEVRVYGRQEERVQAYIGEMEEELKVPVKAASIEEAVQQSNVVITTTPSKTPLIKKEWLHPGLHITAMGSDAEEKNEIAPEALAAADIKVCDSKAQVFRLGEFHHAESAGLLAPGDPSIVELGTIINEKTPGRTSSDQITICDLTGTGVQDTAIAVQAFKKLRTENKGTVFGE